MSKQQTRSWSPLRILRRIVKYTVLIAVVVALVAGVGVIAVWGHFWDFHVDDPTSESCANCHPMDMYVNSQMDESLLVSDHIAHDLGCIDCHEYGLEEQIHDTLAYLQNDYEESFSRARYENDYCFQCHEHGSYDQIAWRTTDLGVTDAQAGGTEANPHQPPHYTDLECHSCHRMHRESTLLCWECHTYEFRIPILSEE